MSKRCLHMMEKLSSSKKIMICLISIYLSYSPCLFRFFFVCFGFSSGLHGSTAADSVRSEWPLWHAAKSNAVFARRRIEMKLKLELVEEKKKLLDIREREKENARGARAGVTF
ncbi:hypothetical protein TNCV_2969251 [Trichonephila clavipes]|nr:hypothetical protein TNCV_2969251 [Trichonephila clavipes]